MSKAKMGASKSATKRSRMAGCASFLAGAAVLALPKIASACTPYGLIHDKWVQVQAHVGNCLDDEHDDGAGGRIQTFQYGYIDWVSPEAEAYAVWGNIAAAWASRYGGPGFIGHPITDEIDVGGTSENIFRNSSGALAYLVWNPGPPGSGGACGNSDHVCTVYGAIGVQWSEYLDPNFGAAPTGEEFVYSGTNRKQTFQNGWQITWNSSNGATCTFQYSTLYRQVGSSCALP